MKAINFEYKADTLIDLIIRIQKMEHESAESYLKVISKSDSANRYFYCICRSLFVSAGNTPFRAPLLGEPDFLGNTHPSDWPLLPVEIVNGIPFLIVKNYSLKGVAESPAAYLDYCFKNCTWNNFRFKKVTPEEKHAALNKLMTSDKLKNKLNDTEKHFLQNQL